MDKNKNVNIIEESKRDEIKRKLFGKSFGIFLLVLFAFLIGCFSGIQFESVSLDKELNIYVDDELQTFRTDKGKKVYPLYYKNQLYIPFNGLGHFLDYMTVIDSETGDIDLVTLEKGVDTKPLTELNTEDYNGNKITSSVFENSEYTALIFLASWCPDCKDLLNDMRESNSYFIDNDIQLLSVMVDAPVLSNKDNMTNEYKKKINDMLSGIDFKHILYQDISLNKIVSNSIAIPKMVVFDKEGNLIKIIDDMSFDTLKATFDGIYGYEE